MSLPPACGGSKMMITIGRFLSDLDTAVSALFNADVMFTFIPPYFYIYPTCTYSTFLMSLLPFGRSVMSTMIILNHCKFLSSFSFTYDFQSHFFFFAGAISHRKWFHYFIYIFHSLPVYTTFVSVYLEYVDEDNSLGRKTNQYN